MSFRINLTGDYGLGPKAVHGPLMPALGVISTLVSVAGTVVGAMGAAQAGDAAQAEANYKAKQLEQKANEERAVGQRQMFDKQRQTELTQSRLRAVAAASTGDTTDSGVVNLGGQIEKLGEYDALNAMYRGENAARGYEDMATASRFSGENAKTASRWRAAGTLLDGFSSIGSKLATGYK